MARKWIQKAIKNPGALRAQAKREGGLTKSGKIKVSWARQKAKQGGTVARRANLYLNALLPASRKRRRSK